MKTFIKLFFVPAILFVSCKTPGNKELEPFEKISGEWVMAGDNDPKTGIIVESWARVNDTLFAGKSFEVNGMDSVLYETIQLVASGKDVYYIPVVVDQNNRQPVSFKLTSSEGEKFTFENPEHDFPTTIIYNFVDKDTLVATIKGSIHGEVRSMDFNYTRTK